MSPLGRRLAVLVLPVSLCVPVVVSLPEVTQAATSSEGCHRTLAAYPTLHVGDRGPAVRTLQCALNDLDLGPVAVDGYYGPQTKRAVWKIARGFEADPADPYEITVGFWTLLHGRQLPERTLRQGDHGHAVVVLQRALRAAGHTVVVDGDFGAQTRSVVRSYQDARGLVATGTVDVNTRYALATGGYA